jgi:hypothetical protein
MVGPLDSIIMKVLNTIYSVYIWKLKDMCLQLV